jgi:hypothetical protein
MRMPTLLSRGEAGTEGEQLLTDAIAYLRESVAQDVGLVVIDIVWRAMAGDDEDSAQDMEAFVARLKRIQGATGVAIVPVHHSGKDVDRGMRGSSSLLGALDLVLKVGDDNVIAVEKSKDGPDEAKIGFKLHGVDLGLDDGGSRRQEIVQCCKGCEHAFAVVREALSHDLRVPHLHLAATHTS